MEALTQADLFALLGLAKAMADQPDLDRLLLLIACEATSILRADRSSIFVIDASTGDLVSRIAEKTGQTEIRVPRGKGIVGHVTEAGRSILIADAYGDDRFHSAVDKKTGFCTRNLLTVPLITPSRKTIGCLQVLNKKNGTFDAQDQELCEALAAHAAVAIEQKRLHQISLEKQRLEADMAVARQVQESLRPKIAPEVSGWEVSGAVSPANLTCGDFFDYLYVGDDMAVVVADVVGHDVGSALIATATRAFLRACSAEVGTLSDLLGRVNHFLCHDLARGRFVTCFITTLAENGRDVAFCGAGHGGVLHYVADLDQALDRESQNPPLGLIDGHEFQESMVEISEGDVLLLPSDGLFEAFSPQREMFGVHRLKQVLIERAFDPLDSMLERVFQKVRVFQQRAVQDDDWTAVAIRRSATTVSGRLRAHRWRTA